MRHNFPNGLPKPADEAAIRADERARVLRELSVWLRRRYVDAYSLRAKLDQMRGDDA